MIQQKVFLCYYSIGQIMYYDFVRIECKLNDKVQNKKYNE